MNLYVAFLFHGKSNRCLVIPDVHRDMKIRMFLQLSVSEDHFLLIWIFVRSGSKRSLVSWVVGGCVANALIVIVHTFFVVRLQLLSIPGVTVFETYEVIVATGSPLIIFAPIQSIPSILFGNKQLHV